MCLRADQMNSSFLKFSVAIKTKDNRLENTEKG